MAVRIRAKMAERDVAAGLQTDRPIDPTRKLTAYHEGYHRRQRHLQFPREQPISADLARHLGEL